MEKDKDIRQAGGEDVPGSIAEIAKPEEGCQHEFVTNNVTLHISNLFGKSETIASTVYCKKCGRLSGSFRIKA